MHDQLIETLVAIGETGERLIASVADGQWELPTPCSEWTVAQLVNHMGFTMRTLGAAARSDAVEWGPDDDHLGDDVVAGFARLSAEAVAAWRSPGAFDGNVSVPFEMPAVGALSANVLDVGIHCWDLAVATGQDHGLTAEQVATIDECSRALINDDVRAGGGFGEELDGGGGSVLSSMLAFVGRSG